MKFFTDFHKDLRGFKKKFEDLLFSKRGGYTACIFTRAKIRGQGKS